jgi:hypothetical protein
MMAQHGTRLYGVLVADRERDGIAYALHPACLVILRGMLTDAGCERDSRGNLRLVEMGPATADPADPCNLATCGRPLGEEVTPDPA